MNRKLPMLMWFMIVVVLILPFSTAQCLSRDALREKAREDLEERGLTYTEADLDRYADAVLALSKKEQGSVEKQPQSQERGAVNIETLLVFNPITAPFYWGYRGVKKLNEWWKERQKITEQPTPETIALTEAGITKAEIALMSQHFETDLANKEAVLALKHALDTTYRAVVVDIDGTLKDPGSKVSDYILQRIATLLTEGVEVVIATGRGESIDTILLERLERSVPDKTALNHLHVYRENGARAYNYGTKEVYYARTFTPVSRTAVEHLLADKSFIRSQRVRDATISLSIDIEGKVQDYVDALNAELTTLNPTLDQPLVAVNGGRTVDILPWEINKGLVMPDLEKRLGISSDVIARIGDQGQEGGNDYELLSDGNAFSVGKGSAAVTPFITNVKGPEAAQWLLSQLTFGGTQSEPLVDKINAFYPEREKAVSVAGHQRRLEDLVARQYGSFEEVIDHEFNRLLEVYGEDAVLVSLMDLIYIDTETWRSPLMLHPNNVEDALDTVNLPRETQEKWLHLLEIIREKIVARKMKEVPPSDVPAVYREIYEAAFAETGLQKSDLLEIIKITLTSATNHLSLRRISETTAQHLGEFEGDLESRIQQSGLQNPRVVMLLSDAEPLAEMYFATARARHSEPHLQLSYVSRFTLLSDTEKYAFLKRQAAGALVSESNALVKKGLVYRTLYDDQGTHETGLLVEARDRVLGENLKREEAEERMRQVFSELLRKKMREDPLFARQLERIYHDLNLGDEDVFFIDTGYKGTLPLLLAALHKLNHPQNDVGIFMYGIKESFAVVIPSHRIGKRSPKAIDRIGHLGQVGGFTQHGDVLVGPTSPKEQLLAMAMIYAISKEAHPITTIK